MKEAKPWSMDNYNYYQKPLTSKEISEFFKTIDYKSRSRFFSSWIKHAGTNAYLAYDVTSISTYAKGIADAEYGYNRDKEVLPQINLGLFISYENNLPLMYSNYPGSIIDKEQLTYVLEVIKEYKLKNVTLVMDKGFYKEENINYLLDEDIYGFIMPILNHYRRSLEYIDKFNNDLDRLKNQIDNTMYGAKQKVFINSKVIYAYVYLDEIRRIEEIGHITNQLRADEALINDLISRNKHVNKETYKDRLIFNDGSVLINDKYYKKQIAKAGYLVILSNHDLDVDEVIRVYRQKDIVEKAFDAFKNDLDFDRLLTHTQETTDGKLFSAFIALIAKMFLYNKLSLIQEELKLNNFTMRDLIREVGKIKIVNLSNQLRVQTAPTKAQKVIFKHLGVDEDKLKKLLEDISNL